MCFSGLINVVTTDAFIATLVIIIGSILIALLTLYFYCQHIKKLNKIKQEHRKSKANSPNGKNSIASPGEKSPISSISPQKNKENFDFSKKVNQFDDFSLGSSPTGHNNNTNKDNLNKNNNNEFKINMKIVDQKEENKEKENNEENKENENDETQKLDNEEEEKV